MCPDWRLNTPYPIIHSCGPGLFTQAANISSVRAAELNSVCHPIPVAYLELMGLLVLTSMSLSPPVCSCCDLGPPTSQCLQGSAVMLLQVFSA